MRRLWLISGTVVVLIAVALGVFVIVGRPQEMALPNTYTLSPTAFSFRYPEDWQYWIPERGVLVAAPPRTLAIEPGPSLTIYRSPELTMENSLEEALNLFLRRGPLRTGRHWELVEEITPVSFQGRDALAVGVQGSDLADWPQLRTRIVISRADNFMIYIFALTSPVEDWETDSPVLEAVLGSFEFRE